MFHIFHFLTSSVCDSSGSFTMLSLGGGAAAAGASSSSSVADSIFEHWDNLTIFYVHPLSLINHTFVVHRHRGGFHSIGHGGGLCFGVLFDVVAVETEQWDEISPQRRVVVAQVHALQESVVLEIALRKNNKNGKSIS